DRRIQIVGVVEKTLNGELDYKKMIIPLYENGVHKAWCLAVPYLRMGDLEIENKIEHNYSAAVENFYQKLLQVLNLEREKEEAVVMMGHLQATGSELLAGDRSERTIIGGLESVLPEAFDKDIAYVALGHLHKGQQVSGRNYVRYAGAPLPMSFAEKNFKQGVNLIELQNGKLQNIERLSFDSPVKLLSIPFKAAPWKEVLQELDQLPIIEKVGDEVGNEGSKYPFLEVKIWEEEPQPFMRSQIEAALRGKAVRLARITLERLCKEKQEMIVDLDNIQNIDPFTMASKVYMERYGVPMPESMANLMKIVIQEEQ
ncbi:MAG: exonuclease SbcCD subunit D C-terminal domain-containing protein, partial [Bacteroidales bacterium]